MLTASTLIYVYNDHIFYNKLIFINQRLIFKYMSQTLAT